jgi:hypothetical protein
LYFVLSISGKTFSATGRIFGNSVSSQAFIFSSFFLFSSASFAAFSASSILILSGV